MKKNYLTVAAILLGLCTAQSQNFIQYVQRNSAENNRGRNNDNEEVQRINRGNIQTNILVANQQNVNPNRGGENDLIFNYHVNISSQQALSNVNRNNLNVSSNTVVFNTVANVNRGNGNIQPVNRGNVTQQNPVNRGNNVNIVQQQNPVILVADNNEGNLFIQAVNVDNVENNVKIQVNDIIEEIQVQQNKEPRQLDLPVIKTNPVEIKIPEVKVNIEKPNVNLPELNLKKSTKKTTSGSKKKVKGKKNYRQEGSGLNISFKKTKKSKKCKKSEYGCFTF